MKALVVGGTGFVGMNLVRALVAGGHDVAATRRPRGNTLFARRLGAPLLHADLDDEPALFEAMRGRDVVFMCAGHYPRYSLDREAEVAIARRRTRNTLSAARRAGVRRYVLTSSVATAGPPRRGRALSDEQDPIEPRSLDCVYHAIKAAIEEEVHAAGRTGLEVVTLCPTGIFGELDVKAGTGYLLIALANGVLPFYVEGLTNVVDADDLAIGHILAAERGRPGERYILGGHNLMVGELLETAAELMGVPFTAKHMPWTLAEGFTTFFELHALAKNDGSRPLMAREMVDVVRYGRWVDTTKAERDLGLPRPTPLRATLAKACDWYLRYRYIRLGKGDRHAQHPGGADPERHRGDHPSHPS